MAAWRTFIPDNDLTKGHFQRRHNTAKAAEQSASLQRLRCVTGLTAWRQRPSPNTGSVRHPVTLSQVHEPLLFTVTVMPGLATVRLLLAFAVAVATLWRV